MQKSKELIEVISLVHEKLKELDAVLTTIAFWLFDYKTKDSFF